MESTERPRRTKINGDTTPARSDSSNDEGRSDATPWLEPNVEKRVVIRNVHEALRLLAAWERAYNDERCDRLREARRLRFAIFVLEHRLAAAENDVEILRRQLISAGMVPLVDHAEELARAA